MCARDAPRPIGTSASAIDSAAGGTQGVNKQHIAASVVVVVLFLFSFISTPRLGLASAFYFC